MLNLKTAEAIGIAFTEALPASIDEAIRRRQPEALANDEQFRHWSGRALNSRKPLEDEMTETKQSILVKQPIDTNLLRCIAARSTAGRFTTSHAAGHRRC